MLEINIDPLIILSKSYFLFIDFRPYSISNQGGFHLLKIFISTLDIKINEFNYKIQMKFITFSPVTSLLGEMNPSIQTV